MKTLLLQRVRLEVCDQGGDIVGDRNELLELWGDVLGASDDTTVDEAVVAELADYFDIDRDEARSRCDDYERHTAEEWADHDRSTPDGLIDYWNRRSPLFGILMSHAHQYSEEHPASSVDIAEVLADRTPTTMLDYGVGPATSSFFFERLGWQVTGADVSDTMLDFARWRAAKRDSECVFLDLRERELATGAYDVVVALEVMAHVPDIAATLTRMRDTLTPDGMLVFNVYAPPDGPCGHLFVGNHHVIRHVRSAGFERRPRIGKYYRYQRVEHNRVQHAIAVAKDVLRHNAFVAGGAQLVRDAARRVRR